jgi:O6-methylguanine-DNA--protein-cysteine methyltransferase
VRSDSSLGGYTGGIEIKELLLALEGAHLPTA